MTDRRLGATRLLASLESPDGEVVGDLSIATEGHSSASGLRLDESEAGRGDGATQGAQDASVSNAGGRR